MKLDSTVLELKAKSETSHLLVEKWLRKNEKYCIVLKNEKNVFNLD